MCEWADSRERTVIDPPLEVERGFCSIAASDRLTVLIKTKQNEEELIKYPPARSDERAQSPHNGDSGLQRF